MNKLILMATGLWFGSMASCLAQSIPVKTYSIGNTTGYAPDWERISFSSLPPIGSDGSITVDSRITNKIGYDLSRTWKAGDTADKYLKMGDVSAFGLQSLSLDAIDANNRRVKLSDFTLAGRIPIADLVKAVPNLNFTRLSKVAPLFDLYQKLGGYGFGNLSVAQALRISPIFAKANLSKYLNLNKYAVGSIPNLSQIPLGNIPGWQGSFIDRVPGLNKLPFASFPNKSILNIPQIALTDLTWGQMEGGDVKADTLVISGSGVKGKTKPVPCAAGQSCSYLELSDYLGKKGLVYGKRWVSGLSQKVPGGEGILKSVNGGKEPTGILVYGNPFKVVLLSVDESKGKANFGIYFRFCAKKLWINLGCTPYFIGPVPWLPATEKQPVIVRI